MSFDQDPGDEITMPAADFAQMCDELIRLRAQLAEARNVIEECRDALAEELAAWDIDPPIHHVQQAHTASR